MTRRPSYHFLSWIVVSFVLLLNTLVAADYSIVFIHIGSSIPSYANEALVQARAFNKECPIILVANEEALKNFSCSDPHANMTYISCESLNKSAYHQAFIEKSVLNDSWREGFWRYTSERFLYLDDLMTDYQLQNVFHLEYDNMLYVDLEELLPIFTKHYEGIGATFNNDSQCIAGFMYIADQKVMNYLASCFDKYAGIGFNDMNVLSAFGTKSNDGKIDYLPVIHKEYGMKYPLKSAKGYVAKQKKLYSNHIAEFESIFDGAALGQYLGGTDPRNGKSKPGFVNAGCVFDSSKLTYTWEQDSQGRYVPYATFDEKKYRINNLHIHSKDLASFASSNPREENP